MPEQFTQGPAILQSDIVNNLTTDSSTKPLSAAQGKALKDAADILNSNMTHYTKADGTLTQYHNQDLDTLTTSGRYYIHSNCSNRPISNGGYLEVLSYNGDWFTQVYYSDNNNGTYIRTKHGSNTWTSWEELALNSNLGKQMKVYATTGNIWLNSLTWTHGWNGSYTAPMPAPSGITINHLYAITLQGVNSFTTDFVIPWINGTTISLHSNREWSQDPSASCGYVILYD